MNVEFLKQSQFYSKNYQEKENKYTGSTAHSGAPVITDCNHIATTQQVQKYVPPHDYEEIYIGEEKEATMDELDKLRVIYFN